MRNRSCNTRRDKLSNERTDTHFFSKSQSSDDITGCHCEILREIYSVAFILHQNLNTQQTLPFGNSPTFCFGILFYFLDESPYCALVHNLVLLSVSYLPQMQGLSLDHIMQRLLAAALQSAVDETAMSPPLLVVISQRDGVPSSRHNVRWYMIHERS